MLRVIVLLEGKHSAQSEVLNALDWVFIKAISIFWRIKLFFYSDESLSPWRWRTAPQHEAATSTLYFWDFTLHVMSSACFPSNMMLRIEVHQTTEYYFSVRGSFRCCFANSSRVFTEERIEFGHTAIKPRSVECCSGVCPSVDVFYLHIWSWSSTRVTIRFFVTTLTKAFSINRSVWPEGQI